MVDAIAGSRSPRKATLPRRCSITLVEIPALLLATGTPQHAMGEGDQSPSRRSIAGGSAASAASVGESPAAMNRNQEGLRGQPAHVVQCERKGPNSCKLTISVDIPGAPNRLDPLPVENSIRRITELIESER